VASVNSAVAVGCGSLSLFVSLPRLLQAVIATYWQRENIARAIRDAGRDSDSGGWGIADYIQKEQSQPPEVLPQPPAPPEHEAPRGGKQLPPPQRQRRPHTVDAIDGFSLGATESFTDLAAWT
jgi:hypothetical protein